jgi:two-component system response regulator (stage 0 sporulation protein F)
MDGLDLILQLTRCFLNVKVMAMSGMEDRESALSTAKLLGGRHTLQKPFRMDTLLKIIDYELIH